jgi:predicted alpha/beta-hydrolase family hydrolase
MFGKQVYHPARMALLEVPLAGGGFVSASLHGERGGTLVALGHGAGGNYKTPALVTLASSLAASGRRVLLFNFPYTERKGRIPDPPAVLEGTIGAVAAHARGALGASRLVLGGRSMGGRIASQAVAQGLAADALVFLSYPLHPPGRTEKLRSAHLPKIEAPMLFVQGTKDPFARWDLLEAALRPLEGRARLFPLEGGDHSLKVRGGDPAKTGGAVLAAIVSFLDGLGL